MRQVSVGKENETIRRNHKHAPIILDQYEHSVGSNDQQSLALVRFDHYTVVVQVPVQHPCIVRSK